MLASPQASKVWIIVMKCRGAHNTSKHKIEWKVYRIVRFLEVKFEEDKVLSSFTHPNNSFINSYDVIEDVAIWHESCLHHANDF